MQENLKGFFTTGEFARLCHVKKQTLFHYDDIGLLKPEIRKKNGYRYYSYQQFYVFGVIELLKEFDMPLKEIKVFMTNKSPQQLIELFEDKKRQIRDKMAHLQQLERIIDTQLAFTQYGIDTDFTTISIVEEYEERFFLSPSVEHANDKEFVGAVSEFLEELFAKKIDIGYPIGAILSYENRLAKQYENYRFLYTKIAPTKLVIPQHIRPAGQYIVGFHIGPEHLKGESYEKITNFSMQHNMRLVGDSYEEYVFEEAAVATIDNYVTQIKIRIEYI
ncbi:MerR family transcriptional regulator [Kurthia sibirica]|uniref:BltR family transcriptional regulator n=1 Tax=Kurthia sibirica TaxID=202750 RepID=A0A2U3ALG9_9BACL|nr:MerR family transcriptional regulator [Kurthia sibirica]PWI25350.1 BltR family transcriptional regulator [Kurthia sibirica]GEK35472.1 multidrug-efflux transporter 2 regulator [Kurthia sibirica]